MRLKKRALARFFALNIFIKRTIVRLCVVKNKQNRYNESSTLVHGERNVPVLVLVFLTSC